MLSKFDKPYIKFETNGSFHMYAESSKVKPSDKIHNQTNLLENEIKPVENRRNEARILIYNRVPKCASSTLLALIRLLAKQNKFNFHSSRVYFR